MKPFGSKQSIRKEFEKITSGVSSDVIFMAKLALYNFEKGPDWIQDILKELRGMRRDLARTAILLDESRPVPVADPTAAMGWALQQTGLAGKMSAAGIDPTSGIGMEIMDFITSLRDRLTEVAS